MEHYSCSTGGEALKAGLGRIYPAGNEKARNARELQVDAFVAWLHRLGNDSTYVDQ